MDKFIQAVYFFGELIIALVLSLSPGFHREVMVVLLSDLDDYKQVIVQSEVDSYRLKFLIQGHVMCGLIIDALFEFPGVFRKQPAGIDWCSGGVLRYATLKDNLMARTLAIKEELFVCSKIDFEYHSEEHWRYHSNIVRSALNKFLDDQVAIPVTFLIVLGESAISLFAFFYNKVAGLFR